MTSASVCDVKTAPMSTSRRLSSTKFSTIPLTTTWTRSCVSVCGWALASLTRPWVAQRVWPIPVVAAREATATPPPSSRCAATALTRFDRFPTARTESISSPTITEMPAES